MANLIPLNKFRSIALEVTQGETMIFESPANVTGIVLSCQVTNKSSEPATVTVSLSKASDPNPSNRFLSIKEFR